MTAYDSVVKCKSCDAEILWTKTEHGKNMPVDAAPTGKAVALIELGSGVLRSVVVDTYVSHFATCPNAAEHRKTPAEAK